MFKLWVQRELGVKGTRASLIAVHESGQLLPEQQQYTAQAARTASVMTPGNTVKASFIASSHTRKRKVNVWLFFTPLIANVLFDDDDADDDEGPARRRISITVFV